MVNPLEIKAADAAGRLLEDAKHTKIGEAAEGAASELLTDSGLMPAVKAVLDPASPITPTHHAAAAIPEVLDVKPQKGFDPENYRWVPPRDLATDMRTATTEPHPEVVWGQIGKWLKEGLDRSEAEELHLPHLDLASEGNPRFADVRIDPDEIMRQIAASPNDEYPGNLATSAANSAFPGALNTAHRLTDAMDSSEAEALHPDQIRVLAPADMTINNPLIRAMVNAGWDQSPEGLATLAGHESAFVRKLVVVNPNTPNKVLDTMLENEKDQAVIDLLIKRRVPAVGAPGPHYPNGKGHIWLSPSPFESGMSFPPGTPRELSLEFILDFGKSQNSELS